MKMSVSMICKWSVTYLAVNYLPANDVLVRELLVVRWSDRTKSKEENAEEIHEIWNYPEIITLFILFVLLVISCESSLLLRLAFYSTPTKRSRKVRRIEWQWQTGGETQRQTPLENDHLNCHKPQKGTTQMGFWAWGIQIGPIAAP